MYHRLPIKSALKEHILLVGLEAVVRLVLLAITGAEIAAHLNALDSVLQDTTVLLEQLNWGEEMPQFYAPWGTIALLER